MGDIAHKVCTSDVIRVTGSLLLSKINLFLFGSLESMYYLYTMKQTRLERISKVVEDAIDKLLLNADKGNKNPYLYRYNFWIGMLEKEILKDITVDTARLNVTKFMEQLICHYITRSQDIELINSRYPGYKQDKYREQERAKLFKL